MSISISNLGTSERTYSNNPGRNGEWSNYLNMLSLIRMHDRETYFGTANTRSGMKSVNAFYPIIKKPQSENVSGYPLANTRIKKQNFKVKVPPETETTKRMNKKGINLAYLGANGV